MTRMVNYQTDQIFKLPVIDHIDLQVAMNIQAHSNNFILQSYISSNEIGDNQIEYRNKLLGREKYRSVGNLPALSNRGLHSNQFDAA